MKKSVAAVLCLCLCILTVSVFEAKAQEDQGNSPAQEQSQSQDNQSTAEDSSTDADEEESSATESTVSESTSDTTPDSENGSTDVSENETDTSEETSSVVEGTENTTSSDSSSTSSGDDDENTADTSTQTSTTTEATDQEEATTTESTISASSAQALAAAACTTPLTMTQVEAALQAGTIIFHKPSTVTGEAVIENNEDCPFPVSLASYTMNDLNDVADRTAPNFGPSDFTFQTLFDATSNVTVAGHSTSTLRVRLPACNFQMDIFYGDNYPTNLDRDNVGRFFLDDLRSNSFASDVELFGGRSCGGTVVTGTTTTLQIVKTVINDDGKSKTAADFSFTITLIGSTTASTTINAVAGVLYNLLPGTYVLAETPDSQYEASDWRGDCSADGTITLNGGDNKTCNITNDDEDSGGGGGGGRNRNRNSNRQRAGGTGGGDNEPEGIVLGATTDIPQLPNTGAGGTAALYWTYTVLAIAATGGVAYGARKMMA